MQLFKMQMILQFLLVSSLLNNSNILGTEWSVTSILMNGYTSPLYQTGTFVNWTGTYLNLSECNISTVQFWSNTVCAPGDACPFQLLYTFDTVNEGMYISLVFENAAGMSASTAVFSFNPPLHFFPGVYWLSIFVWSTGNDVSLDQHRWFTQLTSTTPQPGNAFVTRDPKC